MPNALLLGYDLDQPSFRHRMRSIVAPLQAAGWQVRLERLPGGRYGVRIWERRELLRWADVVVLHQIKLSSLEAQLLAALSRHRVFDVDDAIYVRKPRALGEPVGDSRWRRRKFAATCRWVDTVAAGNQVLAGVAGVASREVTILPTSIDTRAYPARNGRTGTAAIGAAPTIVWIGSPENLVYLDMIRPALARLNRRFASLKMRIICSRFPDWPDVHIEPIVWSAATEAAALAAADIGVMPLSDDEWARGKCAFKLLQYMAAALPCVASPIGANAEAVIDGVTGLHARTEDDWERCLARLIESPALRRQFGAAGHAHVDARYAMRGYQADYVALLTRLAAR
jgi:glycosyltransferase involved in cell wall biosynthesis